MGSNRVFRPIVLVQAVAIALACCGSAVAQSQAPAKVSSARPADRLVTVDIAPQSLESALDQFAAQTGFQIVYANPGQVRNLESSGFHGTLSAGKILGHLLGGSGLVYEFINSNTVTVHARKASTGTAHTGDSQDTRSAGAAQVEIRMDSSLAKSGVPKTVVLDTVHVLGTNLRDMDPAVPAIVITAQEIQARGYSSLADLFRHLPQNLSSMTSTSQALGQTEYGQQNLLSSPLGATSVNLHGLGSRATLILVNGHRRAASAQGQGGFTDISSIPLSRIARVEILSEGASAIYGADAVGGVINIVLKKNYQGTQLHVRHEDSSSGADASRIDIAHTFSWTSGNLSLAGSVRQNKPADPVQFIRRGPDGLGDFRNEGGVDARIPDLGQPGVVFQAIPSGFQMHYLGAPLGIIPGGQNGTNLQPSQLLPYDSDEAPSDFLVGHIGPRVRKSSIRINGEQTLPADLKLSYSASFTRQKNSAHWHPTPMDFSFLEGQYDTFVPATNPYNHFGQDVLVSYSYQREFAGMTLTQEQHQTDTNFNVDLTGKLPFVKHWTFDLNLTNSIERGRSDALADLSGPGFVGSYVPFQKLLNGLNVFGDGSDPDIVANNRELLESLVGRYATTFDSKARIADLLIRGSLFELPAGKVEAAIGGQYRGDRYHYQSTMNGLSVSDSKLDSHAVYAEVGFPLLHDQPWAKQLTLTIAARHESFDQSGYNAVTNGAYVMGVTDLLTLGGFDLAKLTGAAPGAGAYVQGPSTPVSRSYSNTSKKISLLWKPFDSLRLRASVGHSFLTPRPEQMFGVMQTYDETFAIPFQGGTIPAGVNYVVGLSGPNVNLKPQVALVRTIGFDYMPTFVDGLSISATYNDTRFDNYIGSPLGGLSYAKIFSNLDKMPPGTFTMGKNGVLLWDMRNINFLGRYSRSIDTIVNYYFDNGWGHWHMALNAMRTLELESRTMPGIPPVRFGGTQFGPSNWAGNLALDWSHGNYLGSIGVHYTSPFRVIDPFSSTPNMYNGFMPRPGPYRTRAGSYTTVDFQLGYQWSNPKSWLYGMTVRLGVQNAFDKPFPFVDNNVGFIANRVNVRGRVVYLDLKKSF